MVIRELIAKLGLKTDSASFKRADDRINKTKEFLGMIGRTVSIAVVGIGFKHVIGLASDANETLNVLEASFGRNKDAVLNWADEFGRAAGRSQYQMRDLAGQLGAVLNPMMDYNADVAAKMSMRLTQLAVDLGSFYNATDDEALTALRSGIVGETEPLKRFGIVMLEANLQAFALEQGITKNIKAMTIAEKTQLRYNFLLDKTKLAHGDAAKTAAGFANASKGLLGGLRDLGTSVGQKLLPAVEWFVNILKKWSLGFADLVKNSNLVEAAIVVLGAVLVKTGISVLTAWLPVIAPFLLLAAKIGLVILVVDDLITMFRGGESVIGKFIDLIFGKGSATQAVEFLTQGAKDLISYFTDTAFPAFKQFGDIISSFVSRAWNSFSAFGEKIKNLFNEINETIKEYTGINIKASVSAGWDWLKEDFMKGVDVAGGFITGTDQESARFARKRIEQRKKEKVERENKLKLEKEARRKAGVYTIDEILAQKKAEREKLEKEKTEKIRQKDIKEKRDIEEKQKIRVQNARAREAQAYARQHGLSIIEGGTTNNVVVNVNGNADKQTANEIAEKVKQKLDNKNKRTINAYRRVGG